MSLIPSLHSLDERSILHYLLQTSISLTSEKATSFRLSASNSLTTTISAKAQSILRIIAGLLDDDNMLSISRKPHFVLHTLSEDSIPTYAEPRM